MRHLRLARMGAIAVTGLWIGSCGGDPIPDPSLQSLTPNLEQTVAEAPDVLLDEGELEPALDLGRGLALDERGSVHGIVIKLNRESPQGDVLVLPRPMLVAGRSVRLIGLIHPIGFKPGSGLDLFGRIIENPEYIGLARVRFVLEGISNLTAGEPRFDGARFFDVSMHPLIVLSWNTVPGSFEQPRTIAVRNPDKAVAHFGRYGGLLPPWSKGEPFLGFYGASPIARPTTADLNALVFGLDGMPYNKYGLALERVGIDPDRDATIEWVVRTWWLDRTAHKIYRIDYGGPNGFSGRMIEVIPLPILNE